MNGRKLRRGFSLIEMLEVMAASAMLLGTAVILIHAPLESGKKQRIRIAEQQLREQIASQWRHDSHAAAKGEQASPNSVTFTLSDSRRITWSQGDRELTRTISRSEEETRGTYPLPPSHAGSLEIRPTPSGAVARLSLTPIDPEAKSSPAEPVRPTWEFFANVGIGLMAPQGVHPQSTEQSKSEEQSQSDKPPGEEPLQ